VTVGLETAAFGCAEMVLETTVVCGLANLAPTRVVVPARRSRWLPSLAVVPPAVITRADRHGRCACPFQVPGRPCQLVVAARTQTIAVLGMGAVADLAAWHEADTAVLGVADVGWL
jgi:hypothetical protein